MKLNNKGMTLIEVIVTLLISSILIIVAGSIILQGFGYFNETENSNKDKYAVDKIAEFVRDELAYATNVVVSIDPPSKDEWFAIAVDNNGHILKETHKEDSFKQTTLYNKDFYNYNTLDLKARCYKNDYRMDLSYMFLNREKEEVYKTANTLELINLKTIVSEESESEDDKHSKLIEISEKSKYKIYYQKGELIFKNEPENDSNGTVADESNCIDKEVTKPGEAGNNKGEFNLTTTYYRGDFVLYKGDYYKLEWIQNVGNTPGEGLRWKKIQATWVNGGVYVYKDIVIYNGEYWQVVRSDTGVSTVPSSTNLVEWRGPYESVDALLSDPYKGLDMTPSYFSCSTSRTYQCTGTIADKVFEVTKSNYKGKYVVQNNGSGSYIPDGNLSIKRGDFVIFDKKYIGSNTSNDFPIKDWETMKDENGNSEWFLYIATNDNAQVYIPGVQYRDRLYGGGAQQWQLLGPVSKVGKGYKSVYSEFNDYYMPKWYSYNNVLNSIFKDTGDVIYSKKADKYYVPKIVSYYAYIYSDPDKLPSDWVEFNDVDKIKDACKVNLDNFLKEGVSFE